MSNELIVPDITVTIAPTGVVNVTPPVPAIAVTGTVAVSNFPVKQNVDNLTQLIPFEYDYIGMSPTGTNPTTIVYKTGGVGGTTVATLTLTYDANNNIQTVARS